VMVESIQFNDPRKGSQKTSILRAFWHPDIVI
jgi:hypothetical protein